MRISKLVAYGEAMLRLTTRPGVPLVMADELSAPVGGAELNCAVAARRSGLDASWVSTVPVGPLGDRVLRHAATHGVASRVERVTGRQGLYFLELATPPRSSTVVYDRAQSAFALSPRPAVPWSEMLDADSCLVVSGITPALGDEVRQTVNEAMSAAKSMGAVVAVDVNYRSTLWSRDEAFAWLKTAMDHIDVLAAGTEDLVRLGASGDDDPDATTIERLGLTAVLVSSKRIDGRTAHIRLTAATRDATQSTSAAAEIVDPVGAGDAAFGTFLALLGRLSLAQAVERAIGAAVSCYGTFGDALVTDPLLPDESGGIRR